MGRCNVKVYQLVCTILAILLSENHRITCVAEVDEVDTLNCLSLFDIEARNDSFG